MTQLITLEKKDNIAFITLNRPEKKNAMSFDLLQSLYNTAKGLKKDTSIRAVIISGSEHNFSAGIDLTDLKQPKKQAFAVYELAKPRQSLFQKAFTILQTLPVPVIAVVEGYCIGAGSQLALAADIRIATPESSMCIKESHWGLVADMGITHTMQGLVRADIAKELLMTARTITGTQAHRYGLVTHVSSDPMQQAIELANEIATRSPDAVLAAKRVVNSMLLRKMSSLWIEKYWQLKLMLGKNSRIAMTSKEQPPKFNKRQFK